MNFLITVIRVMGSPYIAAVRRLGADVRLIDSEGIPVLRVLRGGSLARILDTPTIAGALDIRVHQTWFSKSPWDRASADLVDNNGFVGKIMLIMDHSQTSADRQEHWPGPLRIGLLSHDQ